MLGGQGKFEDLSRTIQSAIDRFAPSFEIDTNFSQDIPDDRMTESFDASWDRVHQKARNELDEEAVHEHGCVIYVLGPYMNPETAVETSAIALRLVVHALENGAVAAKGESAGVAHGVARWHQLGRDADHPKGDADLARICRLAFSRRPLSDGEFLCSVGFHLVGLPEVFVSKHISDDELVLTSIIDRFAEEMFSDGVELRVARSNVALLPSQDYDEDDFKFNPYGAVYLKHGVEIDYPSG
jgi:hypothetical protein